MALEQHNITSLFHLLVWLKLNVEITLFQGHRRNGLATYLTSNLYDKCPFGFHYCPTLLVCDFIPCFCSNQKENTEQLLCMKLVSRGSTCTTRSSHTGPSSPSAMSWVHYWEAVLAWRTYAGEDEEVECSLIHPTSTPNPISVSLRHFTLNSLLNPFDPPSPEFPQPSPRIPSTFPLNSVNPPPLNFLDLPP